MAKVRVSTLAKEFGMTSKELMGHLADMKIPAKSASSALEDAYVAMVRKQLASVIEARAQEVEAAKQAMLDAGVAPSIVPIRGGTDGAQLTFRGLLCPNLGTGGYSFHGPYEHITAEHLETSARIVMNIVDENLK